MKGAAGPAPRLLAPLIGAVLAAHLVLFGAWPRTARTEEPARQKAFLTRSITMQPPAVPEAVPADAPPRARTATPRRSAPAADVAAPPQAQTLAPAELVAVAPAAQRPGSPAHDAGAKARAFAVPGPARLHYQVQASVRGLSLRANGQLEWRREGNDYEARLVISGGFFPSRTQQSTGQVTAEGLAPLRFSDKARSEEAAHFERDKGLVTFSSNRPQAPLEPGAQDRLSVMLQLASMIAGEPARYPAGTAISIQTASTRDAETWVFAVDGAEQLRLPGGDIAGLKLTRNPRREFDQKVELWLAPAMDYLPVRIRLTNPNGDSVDQQWSSTDKG